jgi:hypothetical protein
MRKIKGILSLCLLAFALGAQAQRHELTVQQAVDLAYKNVVELRKRTTGL